jgi:hypothetical protein
VTRKRPLLGLLVVAALAAGLAGVFHRSEDAQQEAGPLGPPGNPSTLCLSVQPGHELTDGFQGFRNSGHSALITGQIILVPARNLEIAGAFVVPISGTALTGACDGFPPPANQPCRR